MQKWASVLMTILCSTLSALFSGLTIGYTSIDSLQLHLLSQANPTTADEIKKQKRARRILPLRKDPNQLLISLVAINAMTNSLLVLFVGDIFEFAMGFLVSSLIVTVFGEMFPQTIFFRYQLLLCSFFAPLTLIIKYVMYPLTKPLSLLLTWMMGETSEVVYNKQQWKALVDMQKKTGGVLTDDEAKLLKGCLSLSGVRADSVMTPLDKVFGLDVDAVITDQLIEEIAKAGYSRIPVMDRSTPLSVVAILLVKDLLMLDTGSNYQLDELISTLGKPTYAVDHDYGLLTVLTHFKSDPTHVAVVRKVEYHEDSDPTYKHIGIITLNDIFQIINQEESTELIITTTDQVERSRNRSRILKILNELKDPRSFNLDSILQILPVEEPEKLLELLELPVKEENVQKIKNHRKYVIKPGVCLPAHPVSIITKGTLTDECQKQKYEAPFVIRRKQGRFKNLVLFTLTECHLVQVNNGLLPKEKKEHEEEKSEEVKEDNKDA